MAAIKKITEQGIYFGDNDYLTYEGDDLVLKQGDKSSSVLTSENITEEAVVSEIVRGLSNSFVYHLNDTGESIAVGNATTPAYVELREEAGHQMGYAKACTLSAAEGEGLVVAKTMSENTRNSLISEAWA